MKKLLTLLCVIALLGALCVPAMAAENTVPVVAEVPADWSIAYLYAWTGDTGPWAWPGIPMSEVDGWYVAYMPDDMENVIINNGAGTQTPDLAVDPGLPVCVLATDPANASVEPELPIEVPAADELTVAGTTVHAGVPAEWESCYLYAWNDAGSNGTWPGVQMEMGEDGFWYADLMPGYTNVVIAEKDGGAQSTDLVIPEAECWISFTGANEEGKYEAEITETAPEGFEPPEAVTPSTDEPATDEPATDLPASDTITVYAMVPAEWTNVRLWAWDANSSNPEGTGDWPGNLTMTQDEDGWYSYTVPGQYNNVLINADGVQTGDQTVDAVAEVWLDCTDPNAVTIYYEKPDIEAPVATEPVTEPSTEATDATTAATDNTTAANETTAAQNNDTSADDEGGMSTTTGIIIAVIAVIVGAVVIFIIMKKE